MPYPSITQQLKIIEAARAKILAAEAEIKAAEAIITATNDGIPTPPPAPTPPAPTPPAPPPPAPTPPAPPPPGPTDKLEVFGNIGNTLNGSHVYSGPPDYVDPTNILPLQMWHTFASPDGTIAKSMNGVEPTKWRKLHVWGQMNGLYCFQPHIVNGKVTQVNPQFGDDPMLGIVPRLRGGFKDSNGAPIPQYPLRGGPRGQAIMTPYTTWHGHTRRLDDGTLAVHPGIPMFVGITMDGRLTYMFRDGNSTIVHQVQAIIGSYSNDFTFFQPNRKIFYVADTLRGNLVEIDRTAVAWTERVVASGLGLLTSIREIDGLIYGADNDGGRVLEINPVTGSVRVVCKVPHAFWIDHFSNDDLCVMTLARAVHRVTRDGVVSPQIMNYPTTDPINGTLQKWVTVDIDRNGTCGPVDTIYAIHSHGRSNTDFWRQLPDGRMAVPRGGYGREGSGDLQWCQDPWGHYIWVGAVHPDEAAIAVQGFSNIQPALICPDNGQNGWAPEDTYNHALFVTGWNVITAGGDEANRGKVPSFTALMSVQGFGELMSLDAVAEMTFDEAEAFVKRGMVGSVSRTISPAGMRGLMYRIYRDSQRFLREGKPLIDALLKRFPG